MQKARRASVVSFLLIHIVQHPDAAGHLRHAQRKFISGNRECDITHIVGNHQAGTCKVRDAETVPCYLSFGCIEADSPNVVETTLPGNGAVGKLEASLIGKET